MICELLDGEAHGPDAVPSSDSIPASPCPQRFCRLELEFRPAHSLWVATATRMRMARGALVLSIEKARFTVATQPIQLRSDFMRLGALPPNTRDELLLPTFQQTCSDKTKFSGSQTKAVQPSACLPSSHSFQREVRRSGRLLLLDAGAIKIEQEVWHGKIETVKSKKGLGHSDARTTMRYTHVISEDGRKIAARFGELLTCSPTAATHAGGKRIILVSTGAKFEWRRRASVFERIGCGGWICSPVAH
jgi:hypothetical protein